VPQLEDFYRLSKLFVVSTTIIECIDERHKMLLAQKDRATSDIHLVVSDDKRHFFCIHSNRLEMRVWEPFQMMDVNEAQSHIKMHIQQGHKVPTGLLNLVQLQYLLQD